MKKRKKEKKRNKKKKKKREREEEKENKIQPTASHPSVKGQRPQERWIGAHWESQEANPLPSYRLSASVCITGYRRSDCRRGRRESIRVRSGPNPDSIIGEANVQNPSLQPNTPPRLPAKTAFKFNILNPSRLKREARAGDYVTFPEILQRSSKANESANVTQTVLSRG